MDLSGVYFLIFFQSDSSAILFKKSENLPSKICSAILFKKSENLPSKISHKIYIDKILNSFYVFGRIF